MGPINEGPGSLKQILTTISIRDHLMRLLGKRFIVPSFIAPSPSPSPSPS